MAEVEVPEAVWSRAIRFDPELWAPNQITHRLRSGAIDGPLVRGIPRWRGTLEFGVKSAARTGQDAIDLALMDLFMAQMSRPGNWCNMPWGGEAWRRVGWRAPTGRFLIPEAGYESVVAGVETEAAGFRVTRVAARDAMGAPTGAISEAGVSKGHWVCGHLTGSVNVLRCAIVREAGAVNVTRDAQGAVMAAEQVGIRTVPDLDLGVGATLYGGTHMRMRFSANNDATVGMPRGAVYAGPWVLPWEEDLGE